MYRIMTTFVLAACLTTCVGAATAQSRLFAQCNAIYAKLCRGIAPGPAMVGKCNRARPSIADKIPEKCIQDFHDAVEGYEATRPKR